MLAKDKSEYLTSLTQRMNSCPQNLIEDSEDFAIKKEVQTWHICITQEGKLIVIWVSLLLGVATACTDQLLF